VTVNRMFRTMLGATRGIPAAFRSHTAVASPHHSRAVTKGIGMHNFFCTYRVPEVGSTSAAQELPGDVVWGR
jgi:hypothetical protein